MATGAGSDIQNGPPLEDTTDPDALHTAKEPMIVGIGSSAGGFEATKELLAALPAGSGLAFVLVPHLDPSHQSHLRELLQRVTTLRVSDAADGAAVQPDHVYVIPANATMTIADGVLRLHKREAPKGRTLDVIDRFFRALAADRGDHAVGVVLSGALSDGTRGLQEIKAAGGFTFAQSDETSVFGDMPRTAIESGFVDVVGSPTEIAMALADLPRAIRSHFLSLPGSGPTDEEKDGIMEVVEALWQRAGMDFRQYKRTTLMRRIHRRMLATNKQTLRGYAALVATSNEEARRLQQEVLIHVTRFFRDPEMYEIVVGEVLPGLVQNRSFDHPLRVWVPGCATGEEAYSLAIVIMEYLAEQDLAVPLQVFATDISDRAVRTARDAIYPETIAEDVSPERLGRFFERAGGGYRIRKHVRGACVFAVHDLVTDPPFSSMDLVSCRNVLVYMEAPLQRRVLTTLHYALTTGGVLMLGGSETVGNSRDLFNPIPGSHSVFVKRFLEPGRSQAFARHGLRPRHEASIMRRRDQPGEAAGYQKEADRVLLERFSPPGLVVDQDLKVRHFRGRTEDYIRHAAGPATLDLVHLVPDVLALEIGGAVKEATKQGGNAVRRRARFDLDGRRRSITIDVTPLLDVDPQQDYFLVTFLDDDERRRAQATAKAGRSGWRGPFTGRKKRAAQERIETLERELQATKDLLRFVSADHEAAMEELRSANEEAISTNEELQSTNEELETTKEELQSTNEELTTLNEELQERNQEVQEANNDLVNLLQSVRLPIVMLGADLRIRRFTNTAPELFNVIATDVGRPFTDIQTNFRAKDLRAEIVQVLKTYQRREEDIRSDDGRDWVLQIHPYRTGDDSVAGVVLVAFEKVAPAGAHGGPEQGQKTS